MIFLSLVAVIVLLIGVVVYQQVVIQNLLDRILEVRELPPVSVLKEAERVVSEIKGKDKSLMERPVKERIRFRMRDPL